MIGSLKSMSFLTAHSKWDRFCNLFRSTQVADIQEQYEFYNVRAFDFHIAFVNNGKKAVFKYNGIYYNTFSVYEYLNYLNKKGDTYVKIVLEASCYDEKTEKRFYEYCQTIKTIYHNIVFIGGYRECDKKQIYKFKNKIPDDLVFYKRVDKLKKNKL